MNVPKMCTNAVVRQSLALHLPPGIRTHDRRILPRHVPQTVPLQNASCLGLGRRATRELLVEADDSLHARGVRGTTDGL